MSAAWRTRILSLAGRIILENGGETYRAEDTVTRMARAMGMTEVDVFGIPSGLFISYTDECGERETSVCRIFLHGTHLARVDRVNQISRRLAEGSLAPEAVMDALREAACLGENMAVWYAQDLLRGDMVSGVTHAARAVMIAAMLAGGALIGTHMSSWMGLADSPLTSPAALSFDLRTAGVLLASSLLAGGGFGALLYAPRKAIIWGGLLGSAGYLCYWAAMECGAAETAAMFIGALVAALGAQIAARRLKMIATVFVTIAILPLVPGVGLYRAMSALATGDMMAGASIAAHTMALILMIALGIGLGTALVGADRGAKH